MDTFDYKACRALVSGGNRGIGEAFVRELLGRGAARVYVGTRAADGAQHLVQEFPERVVPVTLDVTDEAQIQAAAAQAGDITLLVNNAGTTEWETLFGAPDMSAMRREMEINYLGLVAMSRAFAPLIEANNGGSMINVLSVAGIVAVPPMGGYSASKHAARCASDCLRAELAPLGIHVCSLIVGSVDTRLAERVKGMHKAQPAEIAIAGLDAAARGIDEFDTDDHARNVRAAFEHDPAAFRTSMAAAFKKAVV